MSTEKVTSIGTATRRQNSRQHARSRMAGRLFAAADHVMLTGRNARDSAEDHNDPLLRKLAGNNDLFEGSPLAEIMGGLFKLGVELMSAAQPDEARPFDLDEREPGGPNGDAS
jgi:hypothetical protein